MFNDDPAFAQLFDAQRHDPQDKLALAIRIADRAFDEAARRPAPPCPTWCTLPAGHVYEPTALGPYAAVQREHTMTIHEMINEQSFDAVISQTEIQYSDNKIERKMPTAHVSLDTTTLNHEALLEVAKTITLTAENLERIQK